MLNRLHDSDRRSPPSAPSAARRPAVGIAVVVTSLALLHAQDASASAADGQTWQQREQDRIAVLQRISPSVVCVMASGGDGGGSGVLISADGYAITNYHVTSGAGSFLKCGLNDGHVYDAVLVGIDPTGDISLIRLLGRTDFPYATAGNSDDVRVGDEVMALGNPFLLADDFTPTVTYGIVSGIHRYQYPANTFLEYTDCIQIDASINPGNSGGPLFDRHGHWIGINGRASFEQRGRVNVGAAYAISVRQILLFLSQLKSGRIVDHGNADLAVETDTTGRVIVADVDELSEAWRRGLRPGDEVISFADRALTSANDFKNILGIFPAGTRVPLTWQNRDSRQTARIRLRPLHEFQQAPEVPEERHPSPPEDPHHHADDTKSKPPEQWAHLFESREGFANYAFNRSQQTRLIDPLQQQLQQFPQRTETWTLKLSTDDNDRIQDLVAGASGAGLTSDNTPWHQDADELTPEAEPPHLPGLLTGTIQLHRLLASPRDSWSSVVYLGTEQHSVTRQTLDVLQTQQGSVTCRWLFADNSPFPAGVDVETGLGQDESRLLFDGWRTDGPYPAPIRIGLIQPENEEASWLTVDSAELRQ